MSTTATQEAQTSDQLLAEVERLEAELATMPARAEEHRAIALDSTDDAVMSAAMLTAKEIEEETIPKLKIKIWHARKNYLLARKAELAALEPEAIKAVIAAAAERDQAQRDLELAEAKLKKAELTVKTAGGKHRGFIIELQRVGEELVLHDRQKPVLKGVS